MVLPDPLRRLARRVRNRLDSQDLSPLARRMLSEGLTYLAPAKLRRIEAALASVQQVPGDFAEFGVALGGSGIVIASQANARNFHGFDVFGMIPEPTSEKDDAKSRKRYGTIKEGKSQGIDGQLYYGYRSNLFDEVKESFARHGVAVGGDVLLHRGLFEECWPKANVATLAFVHIDCDWHDPVEYCLRAVNPLLSANGAIVIDDYHDYGGCRTAVDDFLAAHPDYAFEDGANPILRKLS